MYIYVEKKKDRYIDKHGNSVRTSFHLRSILVPCGFFYNHIIAVTQLKHLISKTPGHGPKIFKMGSTIFVLSKLTEILENFKNLNLFDKSKLS